jgi:hypothetical protein
MSIFVPAVPSGYTIFCDEIRQENTGKLLYIGVYVGDIILTGTPPFILPTFTAYVNYLEKPEHADTEVTFELSIPGHQEPIYKYTMGKRDPARSSSVAPNLQGEDLNARIMLPIRMTPLILTEEGLIKVRAFRGQDEIRLGALVVRFIRFPAPAST